MKRFIDLYRLLNVLSLDVTAGAMVSAMFFARILHVHLLIWAVGALGTTVWIIYTVDHLIDAKRVTSAASSRRHRFHQEHFKLLAVFLLLAVMGDVMMITFLRKQVLYAGVSLSAAVAIYFLLQRRVHYVKEVSGAVLYVVGILLPAWSLSPVSLSGPQRMLVAEFGITVLCNLLLFSLFDFQSDLRDQHPSLATAIGSRLMRVLLSGLFAINGVMLVFQLLLEGTPPQSALIILVMNAILVFILIFQDRFEIEDRFRLLGDAIFLVPILYFLS